ncbi:MAG: hypothetical protein AAGF94_07780 [Pseudomonadota bacterium]
MQNRFFVALALVVCWVSPPTQVMPQGAKPDHAMLLAPSEGGVRRWQGAPGQELILYQTPSRGASQVSVYAEGEVFSNRGCTETGNETWCEVQTFPMGAKGFALADALVPVAGPDGVIVRGANDSRDRAKRRKFDDRSTAPCAQEVGQELGTCDIAVARSTGGDATVSATFSNGFSRLLFFEHGAFLRADTTMSGVGTDTEWRLGDDLYLIRVDDQRFEIPVSFVIGD